jgi:hypothetical protein
VSGDTADDLWAWLAACRTCGEIHEYREVPREPWEWGARTWASPIDGHTYRSRYVSGPDLIVLRAEWDRDRALSDRTDTTDPEKG